MDDFHFLRPMLLLVAIPAIAVWFGLWRSQHRDASWQQMVDSHLLPHLLVGESKRSALCPIQLLLAVWIIATVSLAGPTWRMEPSPFADDQAGLVVIIKIGESMLATDVQPSRLERARHKLKDLLDERQGSATGLIVYSGSAHLVMPLTRDDRIISAMLEDLTPDLMPVDGDALLEALQKAEQVLRRSGVAGSAMVIADSVSPQQATALSSAEVDMPVQFLSLRSPNAAIDSGLQNAAAALNAPVVKLTVDPSDIERVARRAQTSMTTVSAANEGTRWLDAGYTLVPFLAFITLMWSRRGWAVR